MLSRRCTALLLDEHSAPDAGDLQLHSLAHGVIVLDHLAVDYGSERHLSQVSLATDGIFSSTAIRWRRRS